MKKSIIIVIAILAVLATSVYIYATVSAKGRLTMEIEESDAKVSCSYEISASGKLIHAKMELYQDGELIDIWEDEASDHLGLFAEVDAISETLYRLECSCTVDGKLLKVTPIEKRSPQILSFRDPENYDWTKIKLAAQYLVDMDVKDRLTVLDKMGVQLPEAYQKDADLRDSSIDVILTSAAKGHWGAYDYIAMVELQERILTALENTSFIGDGFEFPDGSYEVTPTFTPNNFPQFRYPLNSYTISAGFGPYSWDTDGQAKHTGIDLQAEKGTEIHAAADGTITFADSNGSYGYLVAIDHGNGLESYYAHCQEILTEEGATVSQGDVIAKVGSTGYATGPHCHFEIRLNGTSVDPLLFIGPDLPVIEGLGFVKNGDVWIDATGIDARIVEYTVPMKIGGMDVDGSLYYANPVFLGSYFDGKSIEGSASWVLGPSSITPYATIEFSWTEKSPKDTGGTIYGPGIRCTVDVIGQTLIEKSTEDPYGDADFTLTDEELIEIGRKLASILYSAQYYYQLFHGPQ